MYMSINIKEADRKVFHEWSHTKRYTEPLLIYTTDSIIYNLPVILLKFSNAAAS